MTMTFKVAFALFVFGIVMGAFTDGGIISTTNLDETNDEEYFTQITELREDLLDGEPVGSGTDAIGIFKILNVLFTALASVFCIAAVLVNIGFPLWVAGIAQGPIYLVYANDIYAYWRATRV